MFIARGTLHRNFLAGRNHTAAEEEATENTNTKGGDADEAATKEKEEEEEEDDDAVQLLPLTGLRGWRRQCVRIANMARRTLKNRWFNSLVLFCISWASLSVGIQTYPNGPTTQHVLDQLDLIVLSVFILECMVKIIAEGLKPWVFFTGSEMRWNNFDFAIIILSLPMWGSALGGGNIAILRMLRLLRIMKLVKRIPQLYMIIMGLIGGLKSIGYILLLLCLVFYLYAISGMYAWGDNDSFHFRSVPIAMITLFRMSTLENWSTIMNINYFGCDRYTGGYYTFDSKTARPYQLCNVTALYGDDATEDSISSSRMLNSILAMLYFITFVLISAFVMLSLFIGAITMSMTESMEHMKAAQEELEQKERLEKTRKRTLEAARREREKIKLMSGDHGDNSIGGGGGSGNTTTQTSTEKLSASARRDRQKMRAVLMQTWDDCDLTDILTQNAGDTTTLRGLYLMLASKCGKLVEHPKFSGFITIVICMAGAMVGLQTSPEVQDVIGGLLNVVDTTILVVFTTEVALKLVAEGLEPWLFFRTGWNTFDFIIVVGSFTRGQGGMLTMLRLLRLLRVLKLVRAFPQLQVIVSALMKGVSSIGYIGLILLLCFYVFGIIGNLLFAGNDPFHFEKLHFAMLTLFQLATMDGWSEVLYINFYGCKNYGYDTYIAMGYTCESHASGYLAVLYFGAFIVLGGMVLITLFIGVVTTSMEEATQEMEAEKLLLTRVEELRVRRNVEQDTISSYMQVFRMLDLDGSGSVEEAELRIGLAAIGKYPSYEELKEMMDVVDEDGSGQIDIVEFVEFMLHVREKASQQQRPVSDKETPPLASSGGRVATGHLRHDVITEDEHENDENDSEAEVVADANSHAHTRIHSITNADGLKDSPGWSELASQGTAGSASNTSVMPLPSGEMLPPVAIDYAVPVGKEPSVYFAENPHDLGENDKILMVKDFDTGTRSDSSFTPVASPRTARSSSKYKIVPSG